MITRTTVTDDSGTGTDGTIGNQAWLTTFYDTLDARWSRHTSTLTGAQNNLDVDEADLVLLNGASDGAFTGLAAPASPAKPGKITIFKNIHATSIVTFAHNSGSSSAGNKFFNTVTTAATPVSTGGWIAYQYDDVNSRWNLIGHNQGAWITSTFAAGDYTGSGSMTWTVESADRTTCRYRLSGRLLSVFVNLSTTTVGGTPAAVLLVGSGQYGGFTITQAGAILATVMYDDNGAGLVLGYLTLAAASLNISKLSGAAFTASTNLTRIWLRADVEVT